MFRKWFGRKKDEEKDKKEEDLVKDFDSNSDDSSNKLNENQNETQNNQISDEIFENTEVENLKSSEENFAVIDTKKIEEEAIQFPNREYEGKNFHDKNKEVIENRQDIEKINQEKTKENDVVEITNVEENKSLEIENRVEEESINKDYEADNKSDISNNTGFENSKNLENTNSFEQLVEEKVDNNINENFDDKPKGKLSFLDRLKNGLTKTRTAFNSAIDNLVNGKAEIDDDLYDELEEILISADMGVETTVNTIDELRNVIADKHIRDPKLIKGELENLLKENLKVKNRNNDLNIVDGKQTVILVIGVNGVGKTTTIGKLAYNLQKEGKSVLLAAGDTFRAAAIDQLQEWADRVNVDLIKNAEGSDPASIVFDALHAQKSQNKDVLIIDTAGRLHNKKNLMNELEKINRIIDREHPDANKETLLVLDATTGQNAVFQAKEFNKVTEITGIILTKLDGTAKGGVVFPLQIEHNIPVKYIGIGEQKDNLEKFDSEKFVDALF